MKNLLISLLVFCVTLIIDAKQNQKSHPNANSQLFPTKRDEYSIETKSSGWDAEQVLFPPRMYSEPALGMQKGINILGNV